MPRVSFAPSARADLDDIALGVEEDASAAGEETVRRILDACDRLAAFPRIGRLRPVYAPELRSFVPPSTRYVIYYYPLDDGVEIVHVLHGRRDAARVLRDEGQ
ncbi:plasmid stabilization protein [Candidatus Poribacteria bacterium]|nr:plasmid stabilization protein [Candidatus Poribacteria bacterium]